MRTLMTLYVLAVFLLSACKKDYTCICESKTITDPIYFNNKVETEATSSSTFDYETMNGKEKTVKKECNQTTTQKEINSSLPEGRTGGSITYETTCTIQ